MSDRGPLDPRTDGPERFSDRLKREWTAASAFLSQAPDHARSVRENAGGHAMHHARRGAAWVASWFSLWEGALDLALMLLALVAFADAFAPRTDLPWKPLTLNDPVGALTRAKLTTATQATPAAPDQCRAFLQGQGVAFTATPIASDTPSCVVPEAITLGPEARLSPVASPMDCGLASAYLVWQRQVVEPAAREYFAADVERVNSLGVHQCRNIARTSKPSEHMQAKAIDVGSITLSNGETISVAKDWADPGPKGRFLHAIRDGACKTFSGGALSPDYNADHHDHLHLDVGGYGVCG